MNGINVLMDINSGAVHAVDDVAYDIADLYTEMSFDEICDKFSDKYSREQLKDCLLYTSCRGNTYKHKNEKESP